MRRLYIADVHATLPAFEAVLADAGAVDEIVFAGDVVGYGPHPAECVQLLMQLDAISVVGNHDAEVITEPPYTLLDASSPHQYWLRWTHEQLTASQRDFLAGLPVSRQLEDSEFGSIHLVHSVGETRLHHDMSDQALTNAIAPFSSQTVICGHGHRAIDRTVGSRRIIALPGVGQFRDGDPRPGYALQDGPHLAFRYVDVDMTDVARDVKQIGLPAAFTERWCRFITTGHDPEWSRPNG